MDTTNILPALKPHDWAGRETAFSRPLLSGEEAERMPVVAFGYDRPHTFEFLVASEVPGGPSSENLARIEVEALDNLRKRPGAWSAEDIDLGENSFSLAICGDDFLAAERILDDQFMSEAHRLLEAEMLAVGIPRRGMLLAINFKQGHESIVRLAAAVSAQHYRADTAPISPLIFMVHEGKVVGYGKGLEDVGKEVSEADSDVFISEQVLVVKEPDSDRTFIELIAGGQDLVRVARMVQNAIIQIAQQYRQDEQFGGQIHVRFVPEITPEAQAREAIPSLESHLNGVMREAQLQTARGEPIQVRLFYGKDEQ